MAASKNSKTELVEAPAIAPDIMQKFLAADGPTLRAVFDNAIAAWKTEDTKARTDYHTVDAENVEQMCEKETRIKKLQDEIDSLKFGISAIEDTRESNRNVLNETLARLDQKRSYIEQMHAVFEPKMKGFE